MMYYMKNIINHEEEITLPKCMYRIKNPNECLDADGINISDQVIKFLKAPNKKMVELQLRQDQLLKKLDILYDRIKTISSYCSQITPQEIKKREIKPAIDTPDEIVLVVSPDNLPWFLNILLKDLSLPLNLSWHIHSSVPTEKVPIIKAFVKNLPILAKDQKVNLRLIFKCVSADSELKLSSLTVPVVGTVNILRYLAFVYPSALPNDDEDYQMDHFLDLCHVLERTPEKSKETVVNKIFLQNKNWIYKNEFSVVDIALYNIVKQWQNASKYVPKSWFDKCEKICM